MSKPSALHEDYSRPDDVKAGSDRSFGLVFAVVFTVIGLWPLIADMPVRDWAMATAGALLTISLAAPKMLRPLNLLWFKFGLILHKIMNPVVMGLVFFTTVVPIAIIFRLIGKDPLNRRFDLDAESYWIKRDPSGPEPGSMRNQF